MSDELLRTSEESDLTPREKKMHARQNFLPLATPKPTPDSSDSNRDEWIEETYSGFVAPSKANKEYYRVLLETLWPEGHGIPGPYVTEDQLRSAIDAYRMGKHTENTSYKPYVDVFRRMRELAGEEGVTGIARVGRTYQLVRLTLAEKRVPRVRLDDTSWTIVVRKYGGKCAVCGRGEPDVSFDQDHKVPRVRGGGDEIENWQPLCDECNNFKSTSCRGCQMDCYTCSWAFPEVYAPLRLTSDNITKIRAAALADGVDPHDLLNTIIDNHFNPPSV